MLLVLQFPRGLCFSATLGMRLKKKNNGRGWLNASCRMENEIRLKAKILVAGRGKSPRLPKVVCSAEAQFATEMWEIFSRFCFMVVDFPKVLEFFSFCEQSVIAIGEMSLLETSMGRRFSSQVTATFVKSSSTLETTRLCVVFSTHCFLHTCNDHCSGHVTPAFSTVKLYNISASKLITLHNQPSVFHPHLQTTPISFHF